MQEIQEMFKLQRFEKQIDSFTIFSAKELFGKQ